MPDWGEWDWKEEEEGTPGRLGDGVLVDGRDPGATRRAAAARMVARRPELLVPDDLSGALDVETERILWDRLLGSGAVTCLAVAHRRAPCAEMRVLWHDQSDPAALL